MNERAILERVTTLLSHYWTAADAPEVRKLQMSDWLEDLGEFPAMFVAEACKDWRHAQPDRRPTPGHIRKLAIERRDAWAARNAKPVPRITDERRAELERQAKAEDDRRAAEAAASRDRWAQNLGYANFAAWNADPYPRAPLPARFPSRHFPERPAMRAAQPSAPLAPEAPEILPP